MIHIFFPSMLFFFKFLNVFVRVKLLQGQVQKVQGISSPLFEFASHSTFLNQDVSLFRYNEQFTYIYTPSKVNTRAQR